MTASLDNAPDPDFRATRPDPAPPWAAPARRASRRRRLLLWWLGLSVLAVVAFAACLLLGLGQFDLRPLHIVINGDDVTDGMSMSGFSDGAKAMLAVAALFALALLVLMIPLLLLLAFAVLTVVLFAGIVLPIAGLALVLAVVTSPLWLVGLLVWLLARRRASHDYARSARMTA
jgi:hypothetical protein